MLIVDNIENSIERKEPSSSSSSESSSEHEDEEIKTPAYMRTPEKASNETRPLKAFSFDKGETADDKIGITQCSYFI